MGIFDAAGLIKRTAEYPDKLVEASGVQLRLAPRPQAYVPLDVGSSAFDVGR
jgi:hypothetical protein